MTKKTDFQLVDISMKITNALPCIRITDELTVTVNNRKNNVLNIQALAKQVETKAGDDAEFDQVAFMKKAMDMLVGKKDSDAIEDLDLPMPEYKTVYETIMAVASGTYGEEATPTS